MLALKYLLVILGIGLFGSSGALVAYDIYLSSQLRRLLRRRRSETSGDTAGELAGAPLRDAAPDDSNAEFPRPLRPIRWVLAQRLAAAGVLPILLAYTIAVVPDGFAGVRVSQIWGARPGTLYPGVHLITPLVDNVELYDTREQVYTTAASPARGGGSAAAELHSCQFAACGWRRSCRADGGYDLPATGAELHHARNFRDEA